MGAAGTDALFSLIKQKQDLQSYRERHWTGTLEDTSFEVPEARGCGALTDIINNLLSLPSAPGNNATRLPFSLLILYGPGAAG